MTTKHSRAGFSKTRRDILKATTGLVGAAASLVFAPNIARAQSRTIKIGLVTPTTGPLAFFAECDAYVVPQFRQAVANGIKVAGNTYPVEVIVKDSQSNSN